MHQKPPFLSMQVILSHGNARLTFPLPSGIQQSAVVKAVDEDGKICFKVIVKSLQVQTELDQKISGCRCLHGVIHVEDLITCSKSTYT